MRIAHTPPSSTPSYLQVKRGMIRVVGGPGNAHRLYGNRGCRKVLADARNGTIDPGLARAIASEPHRYTAPGFVGAAGADASESAD